MFSPNAKVVYVIRHVRTPDVVVAVTICHFFYIGICVLHPMLPVSLDYPIVSPRFSLMFIVKNTVSQYQKDKHVVR
jgi:hypothetical protein